ncbi:zinc-dependent peptidase, partial [Arthrospira platensis SPKY1]|nr:zinc-dependent peptidase [Arthrospira platensis SPKY1]
MFESLRRLFGLQRSRPVVDAAQWARVEAALPFLDFLDPGDRLRLRDMTLDFLEIKQFHGAQGLQLDDDILLAIALQACLPVLNIGLEAYAGWVGIVVYP